ncbi:MAG: hypothetical protein SVS15_01445, partial [Thermodesulfobacteriota bacterium]|nr:hypothetical protein [Thermodesulfobacteriota bacterium]
TDSYMESCLKPLGIEILFTRVQNDRNDPTLLPLKLFSDKKIVEKAMSLGLENIFLLNLSPPAPDMDGISQAMKAYADSGAPALFSVRDCVDHPCQMKSYFNIVDVGMLHMVESDVPASFGSLKSEGSDQRLTKKFVFDWPPTVVENAVPGDLYAREYKERAVVCESVDRLSRNSDQRPLFVFEDRDTARILFPAHNLGGLENEFRLAGVSFGPDFNVLMILFRDSGGNLFFRLDAARDNEGLLVRLCGEMGGSGSSLNLDIPFRDGRAKLPGEFFQDGIHGYTYVLLKESRNQVYDIVETYSVDNGLWFTDKLTNKNINASSGKEITGRQDFPDIFEIDDSLCIFKTKDIHRLEEILNSGETLGYEFSAESSLLARGTPDFSRIDVPLEETRNKERAIA